MVSTGRTSWRKLQFIWRMDITTVMQKMREHRYESKYDFKRDIELIFNNCREFNEAGTEIVHCANTLTIEFNGMWQEYGLY